jgi:hypothetical protein
VANDTGQVLPSNTSRRVAGLRFFDSPSSLIRLPHRLRIMDNSNKISRPLSPLSFGQSFKPEIRVHHDRVRMATYRF